MVLAAFVAFASLFWCIRVFVRVESAFIGSIVVALLVPYVCSSVCVLLVV